MAQAKSILIVDDDPVMREVTRVHLEGAGFTVALANGGDEGARKAIAMAPAAVIMDLAMPDVSGEEALKRIRANPATARLPVLMLTAWTSEEHRRATVAMGTAWIEKPVRGEDLISALKQLVP